MNTDNVWTCEHCGQTIGRPDMIRRHIDKCPLSPDNREKYLAILDRGDGCIIATTEYRKLSGELDVFTSKRLCQTLGTWAAVAAYFRLKTRDADDVDAVPSMLNSVLGTAHRQITDIDDVVRAMTGYSAESVRYWEEYLDLPVLTSYTNKRGELVRVLGSNGLAWRNALRQQRRGQRCAA